MNAEFYTSNRQRLLEMLEEGSIVFLYSGLTPVKSNDQDMHPFPVNRSFYYLTGIDAENVWLVMAKSAAGVSARLFIDQPDEELIKWNGKMLTREEAAQKSGIPAANVLYAQDMDRIVAALLSASRQLTGINAAYLSLDRLSMNAPPTPAEQYAARLRERYPALTIKNVLPLLAALRSIKQPEEIECIRRAGDVTIEALRHMLQTARPGEYEYQWQADFEHYVARAGMRLGFTTIAASGENAVMLHYSDNSCTVRPGDLILFDLGAEYGYYSSDVSRTFPVSGKFTERQKELFTIVREAMESGRPWRPLRRRCAPAWPSRRPTRRSSTSTRRPCARPGSSPTTARWASTTTTASPTPWVWTPTTPPAGRSTSRAWSSPASRGSTWPRRASASGWKTTS